jgi:hypothetical protein
MMASNPAVEDVNLVLFSLANVSRQLAGGPPLPTPRSFSERLPFGLRNAASVYTREVHKAAQGFQPTSQFVGMMESYPDSVHDLLYFKDPLSDSSSTGDSRLEGTSAPPRMCAMADGDPPPEVVPSEQNHTPADHRERSLTNAQAHSEALLHHQQMPPPVEQPPRAPSGSKGINPAGFAHRHALRVNHDIINDARMQLPQEFCAGQNIAAAAILLQTLPEQEDPAQKGLHYQVRNLVELAAVQQAESSSLHRR